MHADHAYQTGSRLNAFLVVAPMGSALRLTAIDFNSKTNEMIVFLIRLRVVRMAIHTSCPAIAGQ